MTPILGIWASQMSGHLWAPAGAYDALATVTVPSGGAASITFAGIPTEYKHLQIRAIGRCNGVTTLRNSAIQFNGDTASNYSLHELYGDGGGSATAAGAASQTTMEGFIVPGSSIASNIFGAAVIDILDYANTTKYKTLRSLSGDDNNGAGRIYLYSGSWRNTAAINSVTISIADNFSQYSSFALYGIR